MERRALRITDVEPRRRGRGRVGGEVCGVKVVSSGGLLGSGMEINRVEIDGNWKYPSTVMPCCGFWIKGCGRGWNSG